MTAIYKKELRTLFTTMTGWIFIAVNIFITSMYFVSLNLTFGSSDLSYTLGSVIFMFIFTVPVLTMRSVADEKRQKTDQLILTSSVSVWRIVTAKYLAMITVFLIPVCVFSAFPVIMSAFGNTAITESYCSLIAFFLLGAACIALGLFISSLTESLIVAAVLSIALLFVMYQVSGISYMISQEGNLFTAILGVFDITKYFDNMSEGVFDITSVVYFLSLIYVCLFLSVQTIRKRSYTVSRKGIAPGAYSLAMTAMAIVSVIFVNLAVGSLPDRFTEKDMTSNRLYSLSEASESFLRSLDKDVTVYVLNSEDSEDEILGNTLHKMEEVTDRFKVEYRDPVEYPDFYKDYTDGNISFNSLIVTSGDKCRVVDFSDCYTRSFSYSTFQQTVEGYDGEGQVISAVNYVTRDSLAKVYLLTGHGEREPEEEFKKAMTKVNVEWTELNLAMTERIPDDAKAIIISAPERDLTEDEASKLDAYIKRGGKLLINTAYFNNYTESMPYLSRVLKEFGVSIEEGQIFEGDSGGYFQRQNYLLPKIESDSITEGIYDESYIFMPVSQSITVDEGSEDTDVKTILKTGEDSKLCSSEGEVLKTGSFNTGIRAVKTSGDKEAELILFTCGDIFSDAVNAMTTGGNLKLFANCISEFTDSNSNISIPVKQLSGDYLMVSQGSRFEVTVILTVILPAVLIASGAFIMYRRRKR
ncbi:MAG: Gldg family protein [Candidatus Avilachnospira sp.]|jgi:ABC-2 type transport system permease protein